MYEKRKALTHEYPSKVAEFEKWGFDPKQHHHILRLYDLLQKNLQENNEYRSFLTYSDDDDVRKMLLSTKRNKEALTKEEAEEESDDIINRARELVDYNYHYEVIDLDAEINKYIEDKIRLNLLCGCGV